MSSFQELLGARWEAGNFLCVGLDPSLDKIPRAITGSPSERIFAFNQAIVDATHDLVCAFKPNSAFYEAYGAEGWDALRATIEYIHTVAPRVPVILDAKRADIGNTNDGYVEAAFDVLKADAITIHPYLGAEAVQPFLDRKDKGIFVICRTSNHGAEEFQDLDVGGVPFHQVVAKHVADEWNTNGNCGVVVGATRTDLIAQVRATVGDMPLLIPGVGAQGGDLVASVRAGRNSHGVGIVVNSSRSILYASSGTDFREAARRSAQELHDAMQSAL